MHILCTVTLNVVGMDPLDPYPALFQTQIPEVFTTGSSIPKKPRPPAVFRIHNFSQTIKSFFEVSAPPAHGNPYSRTLPSVPFSWTE